MTVMPGGFDPRRLNVETAQPQTEDVDTHTIGGITPAAAKAYAEGMPLPSGRIAAPMHDFLPDDLRARVLRYVEPQGVYADPYGAAQTIRDLVERLRANG